MTILPLTVPSDSRRVSGDGHGEDIVHAMNGTAPSSFPRFASLPPELRSLIWEWTFPPATIVATWKDGSGTTLRRLEPMEAVWIMLSCREARSARLRSHAASSSYRQEPGHRLTREGCLRDRVCLGQDPDAFKCIDALLASEVSLPVGTSCTASSRLPIYEHLASFTRLISTVHVSAVNPSSRPVDSIVPWQLTSEWPTRRPQPMCRGGAGRLVGPHGETCSYSTNNESFSKNATGHATIRGSKHVHQATLGR
jgi:hypothetical protein